MKQHTLTGFEKYGKTTRRAKFLAEMDRLVPWKELGEAIEPIYPKGGAEAGGRPPVPLQRMLRIYFLQLWFNLSDPAVEEALYDSASMRSFAGIDLAAEPVPDETTVCKFRHLLERNGMGKVLLKAMNTYLRENGLKIGNGTIVDATIISAPSSTKNQDKQRDPEMHQTAKGKSSPPGAGARSRRRRCSWTPQHRHEDLRPIPLAPIRDALPGVVDEQLLPGTMRLTHRAAQARHIRAVPVGELGEAVGWHRSVGRHVLLPQQRQGDRGTAQLAVDMGEVRCRPPAVAARPRRRAEQLGQLRLRAFQQRCRILAQALQARHVLGHHALGEHQRPGDLLVREVGVVLQADQVTDLAHRQCSHRLRPFQAVARQGIDLELEHPDRPI